MTHIALYRKYRPQSFAEMIGQEKAVALLSGAIATKKISHAYLFYGGRGTGKTSAARIFAKTLGIHDEDILEIDAASNRGIDEIRELRENVRSLPFTSTHRVYIIDEVHMLTKEAANAFLKTLEEPPSHVVFILATTDPQKLPTTITSRTQKIYFENPNIETLQQQLISIAKKEGKTLQEAHARAIAIHGNESFRDAIVALEQIITLSEEEEIDDDTLQKVIHIPSLTEAMSLFVAVCNKDKEKLVDIVTKSNIETSEKGKALYRDILSLYEAALLFRIEHTHTLQTFPKHIEKDIEALVEKKKEEITSKKILALLDGKKYIDGASNTTTLLILLLSLME